MLAAVAPVAAPRCIPFDCLRASMSRPMAMPAFAATPAPPYDAVIFSSTRRDGDAGYDAAP